MIRSATREDYATFATLFRAAGVDDPTPSFDRWASDLLRETLISVHAGRVVGYVTFNALGVAGHVRNLVVAPDVRGRGVGDELMRAAAHALRRRGVGEWRLDVKNDNASAIALYEQLGMAVEHRSSVVRATWVKLAALPREPATALPVAADEDDDIERALGLLGGRIAMGRMHAGRVLVQLRDTECAAVGYAAFDPALGAGPFRVARPAFAGTLLDAIQPSSPHDQIQVVVEDDAALVELLGSVGAEVRLELLHYRGALPITAPA